MAIIIKISSYFLFEPLVKFKENATEKVYLKDTANLVIY